MKAGRKTAVLAIAVLTLVVLLACVVSASDPTSTPTTPTPSPSSLVEELKALEARIRTLEAIDLAIPQDVPEHMVWAEWTWDAPHVSEIIVNFEYHVDVELAYGQHGLYHMVCHATIDGGAYYFGLQTDVHDYNQYNYQRGKGLIFSRWGKRDVDDARIPDDGWIQESGHEGDFVGVRRNYDWSDGKYQMRLGLDVEDDRGKWLGVWIKAEGEPEETWIGSLVFSRGEIAPRCYTTLEIYGGGRIAARDIPYWRVTIDPPIADGKIANLSIVDYNQFVQGGYNNTLITSEDDTVGFEIGLDYIPQRSLSNATD